MPCIFRLTFQITKSLENLSSSVVWTGSDFTLYQEFAVFMGLALLREKKIVLKSIRSFSQKA